MLVDDHPIVRAGLAILINAQADMAVCAEAGSPAEAMGLLARTRPDLIVTDITMPEGSGLELIKDVWSFDPRIKTIVLTMRDEEAYAERALHAGAHGFIMKNSGGDAIMAAMRRVLSGGIALSPEFSTKILRRLSSPAARVDKSPLAQLTDREFEIFQLLGEGRDSTDIASQLRLSRKTVDVHRSNIKRKLGLVSSTALIRQAVQWSEKGPGG
jgi:DNA-binding NarL/FixJ family response regulator